MLLLFLFLFYSSLSLFLSPTEKPQPSVSPSFSHTDKEETCRISFRTRSSVPLVDGRQFKRR